MRSTWEVSSRSAPLPTGPVFATALSGQYPCRQPRSAGEVRGALSVTEGRLPFCPRYTHSNSHYQGRQHGVLRTSPCAPSVILSEVEACTGGRRASTLPGFLTSGRDPAPVPPPTAPAGETYGDGRPMDKRRGGRRLEPRALNRPAKGVAGLRPGASIAAKEPILALLRRPVCPGLRVHRTLRRGLYAVVADR